jgi:arylformamidase
MDSSKRKLFDISLAVRSGMVRWPGDPDATISSFHSMSRGDAANVSKIDMGSHTGTHMDAPFHFIRNGKTIDQMPLDATIGPARVIEIQDPLSITEKELSKYRIRRGERILFKTKNSSLWKDEAFVEEFIYLSAGAAQFLAQRRIRMFGVDYLSVGGYREDGDLVHRTLLKSGIWIVEGLNLSGIAAGDYELICLPIKLWQGDGAPARAVLASKSPN